MRSGDPSTDPPDIAREAESKSSDSPATHLLTLCCHLRDHRDLSNSDRALIAEAASSWAALVWRPGTERPPALFRTEVVLATGYRTMAAFRDGAWWNAGLQTHPIWWRDGALPPVPEATDEG